MKKTFILLLISLSAYGEDLRGSINFSIENLKNDKGVIQVLLFKNPKGFPDSVELADRRSTLFISANKVQGSFEDLPYGTYALTCIHDENQNKKLDTNFFSYPLEGFGSSQNPSITWRKPRFEESNFHLNKKLYNVSIQMKYLP